MPFVVQARIDYVQSTQRDRSEERRRSAMNWIFEAYSNVYNAAMMQDQSRPNYAAPAKNSAQPKSFSLFKPFIRG
jgi:hypothetical protein